MFQILPERWMLRHFSDQALSPRSYTMLTSTFSHRDLWHLGMNMVALNSFAPPLMEIMGRYEFIAFYCSSGMLASFASNFWRRQQALLDQSGSASLGASGAIFSLVWTKIFLTIY
jgi:rhomboid-like protein